MEVYENIYKRSNDLTSTIYIKIPDIDFESRNIGNLNGTS